MDQVGNEEPTDVVGHPGAGVLLDDRLSLRSLVYLLATVSGVCVLSLVIFYTVELPRGRPHIFGPTSDLTTSLWNLLLVPLLVASVAALRTRGGRLLIGLTTVLCVIGAAGSMLLVIDAVPFGVSTPVSVAAVLAQAAWVYVLCGSVGRARPSVPYVARVVTLGRLIGLSQWISALVVGVSLVFGWGTLPQKVIMGIGLVPGLLAWLAWPIWFALLGRSLHLSWSPVRV